MEVPTQTVEIFKILSKGQFINSNSSDKKISDLYRIIDDEQNFDNLYDYFLNINFVLERGNEYFYFSRRESKVEIERKLETVFKWIDIVDFLKTFRPDFCSGVRFSPSEILVLLKTNADLEAKLDGLRKYTDKNTQHDILEKALKILTDDSFIEVEDPNNQQYKALASFDYLEQLILTINIPEDIKNEIPE